MSVSQNFSNHARYVPPYHFLLSAILAVNLAYAIFRLFRTPGADSVISLVLAIGLGLIFVYMRTFPVRVQDRLIRLEETLRLERLLPPDLRPRIVELGIRQLVALRFASDAELPALVRRALDEQLSEKAIKQSVKTWRPDTLRA